MGNAATRVCRTSRITADDVVDALVVASDEIELALLAVGELVRDFTPGDRTAIAIAACAASSKLQAVLIALEPAMMSRGESWCALAWRAMVGRVVG